jgi:hypothetical protein
VGISAILQNEVVKHLGPVLVGISAFNTRVQMKFSAGESTQNPHHYMRSKGFTESVLCDMRYSITKEE